MGVLGRWCVRARTLRLLEVVDGLPGDQMRRMSALYAKFRGGRRSRCGRWRCIRGGVRPAVVRRRPVGRGGASPELRLTVQVNGRIVEI